MKRNQKLLILAGTLVVVSAAAFATTRLAAEPETTETETETVTVYSADAEAVTALSWTCGEETISLERPANKSQVEISAFGSSKKGNTKSSR